ncbi:hypothetical protein Bbelb_104590 [Branchiostoma belcheri]|nr:hypothetical protein Bbelb_104590 [Branchiostoma belcheri]
MFAVAWGGSERGYPGSTADNMEHFAGAPTDLQTGFPQSPWGAPTDKRNKVIDREDNRRTRWIKEAVWIRKSAPVMNGIEVLSHVWDSVLDAKAPPTSATYSGEMQYSSQKL